MYIALSKWVIYLIGIIILLPSLVLIVWRFKTARKLNKRLARLIKELSNSKNKLEIERNKLLTIIDNIPDLVYVKDRESRFVLANPYLVKFVGLKSPEDILGKTDFDYYPKEMASELFKYEQEIMKTGKPVIQKEEHNITLFGKECWFSTSKVPLRDNGGNIIGIVGISRDITERKILEQELERQKEKIKQYLDIAGVMIVVLDREGKIQLLNRRGCEILGIEEEEAIGKNWFDYFVPEEVRVNVKVLFKDIIAGNIEQNEYNENEVINRKGEKRIIAWHNTLIKDKAGNIIGTLSSGEDITEKIEAEKRLKETEKKLEVSQRLEAIGRLTSGIAHDFNNLLSVIIGYSDLLKMRAREDAPYLKEVKEIKKAGERATALIGQLLTFSRKQPVRPVVIRLNKLIKNIEKILNRTIGENIELIVNLNPELSKIKADPSQIEQIIINLAVNAKHAMPNGGRLIVETDNVYLGESYAEAHPGVKPGDYVMLSVSDTGVGMDEETKNHIFEPFFTTRKNGIGTGLGLSTVYGIVKQNKGSIWVYSEPGRGTVFKIYLPVSIEKEENKGEKRLSIKNNVKFVGSNRRVFLLEDEPQVRNMVQSVLETSGYNVKIAKNGEEGLKFIEEMGIDNIDLIITDVIMPKMGGYEFIKKIVELYPEHNVKILFISGYSDVTLSENEFKRKEFFMLQKPFTADQLLKKIEEIFKERI